jgi:hypothetical protein
MKINPDNAQLKIYYRQVTGNACDIQHFEVNYILFTFVNMFVKDCFSATDTYLVEVSRQQTP